jgi:uncharacterized protein
MVRSLALLLLAGVSYQDAIVKWRAGREQELKADGGWLTVTGLFWLKEGANRIDGVPGVFEFHNGRTLFRSAELPPNKPVTEGDLTLTVIERAGRYGVRVKDKRSPRRREFTGMRWFPVRESYRIEAKFVAQPKQLSVPNIIGSHFDMASPGYVVFRIDGRELRLQPVIEEGEKELFFIFRDQTAGKETYPGGRFLYTDLPRDGKVELDFNKAENPPCAFTPYATCPLPPPGNTLPVRIEAGEKNVSGH